MTRSFKTNVAVDGTLSTTGQLNVTASAGDEGGQIFLANAVSNTTIASGVNIDVYQNKLRFWEQGGTNRGYYIDITAGGAGVGTSLTSGSTGAMNYAQTEGTKQSAISSAGTTIVSVSITTNGYPVLVSVTGDMENNSAGGWVVLQLYRGATAIGNPVHAESSAGSENVPYGLSVIDAPSAGTYTYALKLNNSAGGTFNFGESDGPVITVIELSGPKGDTGAAGTANSFATISTPSGTNPVADSSTDTLTLTAGTGITITGDATADSIAIGTNAASANGASTIVLRDASGNFTANAITSTTNRYGTGTGAPTFTSYSAGVRNIYYDNISGSQTGYAVGIDAGVLWHGLPGADGGQFFKWYGGTTQVASLSGTGAFTAVANVSAPTLISTVSTGTAPLTVTSTTKVTNLNADYLDGLSADSTNTINTVVSRDSSGNFAAATITATTFSGSGASLTNVPAANLTGTFNTTVLGNSTAYIGTTAFALNRGSANQALTGISSVTLPGSTSGTIQLLPTAIAGTGTVLTLPATTGTLITTGDSSTVTNTMLAGSIQNAKLANVSVALGSQTLTLGAAATTALSGLTGVSSTTFTSTVVTGTAPFTVASTTLVTNLNADLLEGYSPATTNTINSIVLRDGSGNFSAGTITASLTGTASNATNTTITNDAATATAVYPTWVTANTGNLPQKTTSGALSFVPSTGTLTATVFSGSGASLTNVPGGNVVGTLTSTVLGNSTTYVGTTAVALYRASANQALTGISSVTLPGSTSGTIQLLPTAIAGTGTVLTLPATTGTVALTSQINDATLTVGVSGTGLSISATPTFTANQSTNRTITVTSNATDANGSSTIVARDASGNFTANTVTATTFSGAGTSLTNVPTSSSRNYLVNSAFDIAQRGTPVAITGTYLATGAGYTLDQWYVQVPGNATIGQTVTGTVTQLASTANMLSGGPEVQYYANLTTTISGGSAQSTATYIGQRVEDVRTLAGQTVTLSFWAKASANNSSTFASVIEQNFGSGGSSSVTNTSSSLSLTTSWTKFTYTVTLGSMSGKTIGTSSYLDVRPLHIAAGSFAATTVSIAAVKLEIGSVANTYTKLGASLAEELLACQRYFYRFDATSTTTYAFGYISSATSARLNFPVPVKMRATPTLSSDATEVVRNYTATAQTVSSVSTIEATLPGQITVVYVMSTATVGVSVLTSSGVMDFIAEI